MLYILSIALVLMVLIFLFYSYNPESNMLANIAKITSKTPSFISYKNTILSKILDIYTKTSPVFALLFFLSSYKILTVKKNKTKTEIVIALVLYLMLYVTIFYVFLFCNHDMAMSGRLLRFMSANNYSLLVFFISLFSSVYILSSMLLWFLVGAYKVLKER